MNVIPVTIRIFGITLSFLIPNSRIVTFLFGVIFWAVMGPVIKWAVKELIKNIGAILGGYYVQKDEPRGYERGQETYKRSNYERI